jgi:hypothetical protein
MNDVGLFVPPDFSKVPKEFLNPQYIAWFQELQSWPTSLEVERYQAGEHWYLNYTLNQPGNSMTTSISPWQPFPEAFHSVFPGGWADLAAREGFELPAEFKKKQ